MRTRAETRGGGRIPGRRWPQLWLTACVLAVLIAWGDGATAQTVELLLDNGFDSGGGSGVAWSNVTYESREYFYQSPVYAAVLVHDAPIPNQTTQARFQRNCVYHLQGYGRHNSLDNDYLEFQLGYWAGQSWSQVYAVSAVPANSRYFRLIQGDYTTGSSGAEIGKTISVRFDNLATRWNPFWVDDVSLTGPPPAPPGSLIVIR